ncbi:trypco2 family protein [Streptomyces sp. NPDC001948]
MPVEPMEIELAAVIKALRQQLTQSVKDGEDEEIRFRVEKVSLEAQIAVTKEAGGGVGIKVLGFSADGKAAKSTVSTQTLSLELTAVTRDGGPVNTGVVGRRAD